MPRGNLIEEGIVRSVIGAFFDVYNNFGYGFLEQLYVRSLELELRARGHTVEREYTVRMAYRGTHIGIQRLDMVVDDRIVLKAKSTFALPEIADRQLYNYLKASGLEVGLLLHFGPKPSFQKIYRRHPRNMPMYSIHSMYVDDDMEPSAPMKSDGARGGQTKAP